MTIVEKLDNYAKRSLAHQLTYTVAHHERICDEVSEIFYERAADASTVHTDTHTSAIATNTNTTAPTRDAGVIVFHSHMMVRLYDIHDDVLGYGIGAQTFYDDDHIGEQRNWYRNHHRELTDAQWRLRVAEQIAQDYDHVNALWERKVADKTVNKTATDDTADNTAGHGRALWPWEIM